MKKEGQSLTQHERKIIERIRQKQKTSHGKPWMLIIRHPGGKAPIKLFNAEPGIDK